MLLSQATRRTRLAKEHGAPPQRNKLLRARLLSLRLFLLLLGLPCRRRCRRLAATAALRRHLAFERCHTQLGVSPAAAAAILLPSSSGRRLPIRPLLLLPLLLLLAARPQRLAAPLGHLCRHAGCCVPVTAKCTRGSHWTELWHGMAARTALSPRPAHGPWALPRPAQACTRAPPLQRAQGTPPSPFHSPAHL